VIQIKPRNFSRIIVGVLMIISGIVSILLTTGEAIIGIMVLAAGVAFLITGISRYRKYGDDPESDEWSKKIGVYGLSYASLTGLFLWQAFSGWIILACLGSVRRTHLQHQSLSLNPPHLSARYISSGEGILSDSVLPPCSKRICKSRPNSKNSFRR